MSYYFMFDQLSEGFYLGGNEINGLKTSQYWVAKILELNGDINSANKIFSQIKKKVNITFINTSQIAFRNINKILSRNISKLSNTDINYKTLGICIRFGTNPDNTININESLNFYNKSGDFNGYISTLMKTYKNDYNTKEIFTSNNYKNGIANYKQYRSNRFSFFVFNSLNTDNIVEGLWSGIQFNDYLDFLGSDAFFISSKSIGFKLNRNQKISSYSNEFINGPYILSQKNADDYADYIYNKFNKNEAIKNIAITQLKPRIGQPLLLAKDGSIRIIA